MILATPVSACVSRTPLGLFRWLILKVLDDLFVLRLVVRGLGLIRLLQARDNARVALQMHDRLAPFEVSMELLELHVADSCEQVVPDACHISCASVLGMATNELLLAALPLTVELLLHIQEPEYGALRLRDVHHLEQLALGLLDHSVNERPVHLEPA